VVEHLESDLHQNPLLGPGQEIGGCREIQRLGWSRGIETHLGEILPSREPVCIKVFSDVTADPELVRSYLAKVKAWSHLEHPNLVRIRRLGRQGGLYYVVAEYVPGRTAAELMEERAGPLPWRSAVRMTQLAAKGLALLHRDGTVHGQIEPSVLRLARDSRVVLLEFGLDGGVGQQAFGSPEQRRGEPPNARSDVFSLGAVLQYLLTGCLPESAIGPPDDGGVRTSGPGNSEIPPDVHAVIQQMSSPSPGRRPSGAAVDRKLYRLLRRHRLPKPKHGSRSIVHEAPRTELLPLDSVWESWRPKVAWFTGALVVFVLLLGGYYFFTSVVW